MHIFVSWAGRDSQAIALILRDWLPQVLPYVRPWVSAEDIRKGARWDEALWNRLQATSYAVICATSDAVRSPWVNFEAGVVARAVGVESHVSPVLFGMSPNELGGLPLGRFQCTVFTRADVERLLKAINASGGMLIPESQVGQRFRLSWASLRDAVERINVASPDDPLPREVGVAAPVEEQDLDSESVDDWLEESEEKILETVAWAGDERPVELTAIAREIGENHVHAQHYVDRLVARGFLHERLNTAYPTTYIVTKKGRAYAVENNLV